MCREINKYLFFYKHCGFFFKLFYMRMDLFDEVINASKNFTT